MAGTRDSTTMMAIHTEVELTANIWKCQWRVVELSIKSVSIDGFIRLSTANVLIFVNMDH